MKHYYAAIVLCLALGACTKEKVGSEPTQPSVFSIEATVSQHDTDTKVTLDNNMVKWTAGDQITVLNDNLDRYTFDLTSGDGQTSGSFNYAGTFDGVPSCAVYPAGENLITVNEDESGNLVFKYDCSEMATQTYKFFNNHNLMVGKCDGGSINFKNAFGLLKLNATTGNNAIGDIIVTSLDPDDKLWGEASITMAADGSIVGVEMTNDSPYANQIVYHCVSWPANKTSSVYLLIPDGCLEDGFAVTFFDTDDRYIRTVTAPIGNAITRSMVLNMPLLALNTSNPATDGLSESPSSIIIDGYKPYNTGYVVEADDCTIKAVFSTPELNNPDATGFDKEGKQYVIFGCRANDSGTQYVTFATNGTKNTGYNNEFYGCFDGKYLTRTNSDYRFSVSSPEDIITATATIKNNEGAYTYTQTIEKEGAETEYTSKTLNSLSSGWKSVAPHKSVYTIHLGNFSSTPNPNVKYGSPRIYSFEYQDHDTHVIYEAVMLSYNGTDIYPVLRFRNEVTGTNLYRKILR